MASESTENIRNEVESIVNEAVSRIYKQGHYCAKSNIL